MVFKLLLKNHRFWNDYDAKLLTREMRKFLQETERKIKETQDRERSNLNKVILEERKWYCGFVAAFSKSLVSAVSR